jgi:hypothetical protein
MRLDPNPDHAPGGHVRAMLFTALASAALPSIVLSGAVASVAQGEPQTVWREDFTDGIPRWADWSRCAQPWEDQLTQCAPVVAGPGEQVYWNPKLMRGGRDPVVAASGGGIDIVARPMTDDEHTLLIGTMARQAAISQHVRDVLEAAGWASGWMQTRPSFPVGTTVTALIEPGAGPSSWSGLWMLNDPAHRRWPPEIDVAEVTNDPDGRMRIRQVIHYRDAGGTLRSDGCPIALLPHGWIKVAVTRLPQEIRFSLNGVEHCRVPAPAGFDDPMNLILSQQVGGLAQPSNGAVTPMALGVRWIAVTRS